MLKYPEAISILQSVTAEFSPETVPLTEANGRVLAEALVAPFCSPFFTNSAMDGIAIRFDDVQKSTSFKNRGIVYAGAKSKNEIPDLNKYMPGNCVQIMTGAPLPDWADTIVPVEKISFLPGNAVLVNELPQKGASVRVKGEDIEKGSVLLKAGTFLTAEKIMIAANFGFANLSVNKKPEVLLLCTGDELKDVGEELADGTIYNSSKYFLLAELKRLGFNVKAVKILPDDLNQAKGFVLAHLDVGVPTLIISTGAVSAGVKDFIPDLAKELGFETLLHHVAVRPGKPLFAAKKMQTIWFGLPGNPISTVTSWHFFLRPFLSTWAKIPAQSLEKATLSEDLTKPEQLRCFFRGMLEHERFEPCQNQGSAQLLASVAANAYIVLLDGSKEIKAGSTVDVLRI